MPASHVCESTPFSLAVSIRVYAMAAARPPVCASGQVGRTVTMNQGWYSLVKGAVHGSRRGREFG